MRYLFYALQATVFAALLAGPGWIHAASTTSLAALVTGGEAQCIIVAPADDAALSRTATRLAGYLEEQTGVAPEVIDDASLKQSDPHITWILLDDTKDQTLLSKVDIRLEVPADRDDAWHLQVAQHGKRNIVAATGHSAAGVKYAVYRLMEEMEIEKKQATIAAMDVTASPFFKLRSVSLFNIWRVPVPVIRQCNLESWPIEKIQRDIDTYDAFGFNAIETHDRFNENFLKGVYGVTRAEWRQKVYAMADRAHEDGMTVFLRMWGNSVALPTTEIKGGFTPFGFENLAPDIPADRERWNTEIRDYMSKNYASHIDQIIGHWADAGGIHEGSHATVKDSMLLHNELVDAFRAINPKIETTYNLWGMANPKGRRGWPGYKDERSIADAGILPKDVAIAQRTRSKSDPYSEQVTSNILSSGHPAAVWSWRRADTEVRFGDAGLRIRIHGVVGDYFNNLPDSARQLAWHNIERNHHGLANDVNYYIVGKLMWDPKTNVDEALAKYCELVFGKSNVAAMAEAFNTIEMARDVEKQVSREMLDNPAAGTTRARTALEAVSHIKIPADFHSRLPSVTSSQEMLSQVRDTLAVIAENGQIISDQLPKLDGLLKSHKTDEAKKLGAALQAKSDAWFGTVAGGVEGLWLKEMLAAKLGTAEAASNQKWTGFTTINVAELENRKGKIRLKSAGKNRAFALIDMKSSSTRNLTFKFSFKAAKAGKSHNGGFAFGSSTHPADLVNCQVMVGGPFIRITGGVEKNARKDVAPIDLTKPVDCVVTIDLDTRRVTFEAGGESVEARLKDGKPIRFYGYSVENTASDFSPIEIK